MTTPSASRKKVNHSSEEEEGEDGTVGAGQTGIHANNRETYGHSMIISPWGEIMAENAIDTGIVCAEIDINDRKKLKTNMPVSQHNRFRSQLV